MTISDFDGLLAAARHQPNPQRMLFVFVRTTLQKDASDAERAGFEAGEGGALLPLFCADLGPDEVENFAGLVVEADRQSTEWDKVLVACMDQPLGAAAKASIDLALKAMIARVHTGGNLAEYLCFLRDGTPLLFDPSRDPCETLLAFSRTI